MLLLGCDTQEKDAFSVEVRVENEEGVPVEGASIGVRPCYAIGCGRDEFASQMGEKRRAKSVELVSFEGQVQENGTVLLEWETKSETNNAGFRIEQRTGGDSSYERIGFVEGAGTTDQSHSYQYQKELPRGQQYEFRLVAVDHDGNESVAGMPISVQREVSEPEILPLFPNPPSNQAVLHVLAAEPSHVRSTVYRIDGTEMETLVNQEAQAGLHEFFWELGEGVVDGLYEVRSQIHVDGERVDRDTALVAVVSSTGNVAQIGTTSTDGTVSTNDQIHFPALYEVLRIDLRDADGNDLGSTTVSKTVEFIVRTPNGQQTYRRSVTEGENMFTLALSP